MTGSGFGFFLFFLASAMVLSVMLKKLTVWGAIIGGLIGLGVYAGAGFTGVAMLAAFFVLGTAATAFKKEWKEQMGISKKGEGRRTAGQVLANGGVAGALGIAAAVFPQHAATLQVLLAAGLASATADTMSSELGVVYGRHFYNITTFKKDARGRDGVVSREGTVIGAAGSVVVALIYAIGFGFDKTFFWIVIAGMVGNFADSLLGATLERRHLINNNAVNFLNTLIAALAALALMALL